MADTLSASPVTVEADIRNSEIAYENAVELSQTDTKTLVVLNFKALQLLRIKTLQQELFGLQMRFRLGGFSPTEYTGKLDELDETLYKYGKALRNYELLAQNSLSSMPAGAKLFGAPHELVERPIKTKSRFPKSLVWWNIPQESSRYEVQDWIKFTKHKTRATAGNYILNKSLEYRELDKYSRETRARKHAFTERMGMALFGGMALIAPMLLMALVPGQTASLVTASAATFLFALALAFFASNSLGKDVLAATAAYAAVLVVFVGTTTPSTTS